MTGLWVLLLVVVVAQLAALLGRRRVLRARAWALEEAQNEAWLAKLREVREPGWYAFVGPLGLTIGTSGAIPAGMAYIGVIPELKLEPGPMSFAPAAGDLDADMRRWRLTQELTFGWDVAERARMARAAGIIITGV